VRPPQIREEAGVLLITLDDPAALNDGQSIGLRQPIYQAVQDRAAPRVAVDLREIDFLSSSGVALLIGLKRRVDQGLGRLVLFGLHPHVLDLFRIMRLVDVFAIADDQPAALELLPPIPAA